MTCRRIPGGFVCLVPTFRLRLLDGRYVYMTWNNYCGPLFSHDRDETRVIEDWHEDEMLCKAVDWFVKRGKKA